MWSLLCGVEMAQNRCLLLMALSPTNPIVTLSFERKYPALVEGEVAYTDPFTTDAKLKNFDIKILEDDRAFFPPYLCA